MQNPTPAPEVFRVEVTQTTRPLTRAEMSVIRSQRSEMSEQLTSAIRRRDNLLEDIRTAPAGTEEGLKQQLTVLNDRIISIEKDIEQSGRTLRTGQVPTGTTIVAPGFSGMRPEDAAARGAAITASIIVPILISIVFLRWMKGRRGGASIARATAEQDARMERLEQAVDAIALEVERVGESQRFQGRLLQEANLMPAGSARVQEPVRVRD